jgi:hypothetical protein
MLVPAKWLLAGVRFRESTRRFAFYLESPQERGTGVASSEEDETLRFLKFNVARTTSPSSDIRTGFICP